MVNRYLVNIQSKKYIALLLALIVIVTFFVYIPLLRAFFQQDEWAAFGFLASLKDTGEILKYIFALTSGHYNPLSSLSAFLVFSAFGLHYESYLLLSITLHIVVVLLVFKFASALFRNSILALYVAAFFALNANHEQATSWVLADIPSHGATILGLLSLIMFQQFLEDPKKRYVFFSLIFLILSLFFKEITLGFFIILPFMYYFYAKKTFKNNLRYIGIILLVFFILILLKLFLQTTSFNNFGIQQTPRQLVFNILTFPINGISQSLINYRTLLEFGNTILPYLPIPKSISGYPGTYPYVLFIEKRLMILINTAILVIIAGVLVYVTRNKKYSRYTHIALFGLLFAGINSAVYAFSPGRTGIITLMDSRNLYLPSIGVALATISLLYVLVKNNHKLLLIILLPYLFFNTLLMKQHFSILIDMGGIRKQILNQIKHEYPDLPKKTIIYTDSDSSYYGLPPNQKILPFQSGFGQTLLVWYSKNENWPRKFYQNYYLWGITEQGYMESESRGFGYFRDIEELKKILKKYNLNAENVISFSWNSQNQVLKNITSEVQQTLKHTQPD
jgi:hypothetical protein